MILRKLNETIIVLESMIISPESLFTLDWNGLYILFVELLESLASVSRYTYVGFMAMTFLWILEPLINI